MKDSTPQPTITQTYSPIRIIVDHDTYGRQCVMDYLQHDPGLQIVGVAGDGASLFTLARRFTPDVVMIDLRAPVFNGLETIRALRERLPGVKALAISDIDDESAVLNAIRYGAHGYLLNTATGAVLAGAIRQVIAGEWPLDPVIDRLLGRWRPLPSSRNPSTSSQPVVLTPCEREALQLMARGLTNSQIASALDLNTQAMPILLSSIFSKLRAVSRLDAILTAVQRGWIDSGVNESAALRLL